MKIALNLIGISSQLRNRDWNRTKLGIKEKAIDCWAEQGHEVKTYLVSNIVEDKMVDFYKPTKFQTTYAFYKEKYIIALEQLKDQDVDFIICTRFDIVFFNKLSTWNIDFNKFNFLFREINHFYDGRKWTCDNFYAFPKCYLEEFKQSISDPNNDIFKGMLHDNVCLNLEKLIGENNIHFIQEEERYSGYNNLYILDRFINKPGDVGPTTIEAFNNLTEREIHEIKCGNFTRWL
jgi:hypothetical protein